MHNDEYFRNKYSKMPAREFNDLSKEELEEIVNYSRLKRRELGGNS